MTHRNRKGSGKPKGTAPNKKHAGEKKKQDRTVSSTWGKSGSGSATTQAVTASSSQNTDLNDQTRHAVDLYSGPQEADYSDDLDGDEEYNTFGFPENQVHELLCHGVKPWDEDAWDLLHALHDAYRKMDVMEIPQYD